MGNFQNIKGMSAEQAQAYVESKKPVLRAVAPQAAGIATGVIVAYACLKMPIIPLVAGTAFIGVATGELIYRFVDDQLNPKSDILRKL